MRKCIILCCAVNSNRKEKSVCFNERNEVENYNVDPVLFHFTYSDKKCIWNFSTEWHVHTISSIQPHSLTRTRQSFYALFHNRIIHYTHRSKFKQSGYPVPFWILPTHVRYFVQYLCQQGPNSKHKKRFFFLDMGT